MNSASKIIELRIPKYPECWESCGNCASGKVIVDDILVTPGDQVDRDDTLIVLETGKIALDIPSPCSGKVIELLVAPGDQVFDNQVYMTIETRPQACHNPAPEQ